MTTEIQAWNLASIEHYFTEFNAVNDRILGGAHRIMPVSLAANASAHEVFQKALFNNIPPKMKGIAVFDSGQGLSLCTVTK